MSVRACPCVSVWFSQKQLRDAETRVNAVRALSAVVSALGIAPDTPTPTPTSTTTLPSEVVAAVVLPALLSALDDYSADNRGDVGSWVREAGLKALADVALALQSAAPGAFTAALRSRVAGAAVKQAAEKIDRMRDAAARALGRMLHPLHPPHPLHPSHPHPHPPPLAGAPDLEALAKAFPLVLSPPTSFEAAAWPSLAALLRTAPAYRTELVQGFVVSMGGLGDSVGRMSSAAVLAEVAADAAADGGGGGLAAAVVGGIAGLLASSAKCAEFRVSAPKFPLSTPSLFPGCAAAAWEHPHCDLPA